MKHRGNIFIFLIFLAFSGIVAAQDRAKDIEESIKSLDEDKKYAFVPYFSKEEQDNVSNYLKNAPNKFLKYRHHYSDRRSVCSDINLDNNSNRVLGIQQELNFALKDYDKFLIKTLKNFCDAHVYASCDNDLRLFLRVLPEGSGFTIPQPPHFDSQSHHFRSILVLQGRPTLFYNSTDVDEVMLGGARPESAQYGEIALYNSRGESDGGALHAPPPPGSPNDVARVLVLAEFSYKCSKEKTAHSISSEP